MKHLVSKIPTNEGPCLKPAKARAHPLDGSQFQFRIIDKSVWLIWVHFFSSVSVFAYLPCASELSARGRGWRLPRWRPLPTRLKKWKGSFYFCLLPNAVEELKDREGEGIIVKSRTPCMIPCRQIGSRLYNNVGVILIWLMVTKHASTKSQRCQEMYGSLPSFIWK